MNRQVNIPTELYDDEVLLFLAYRYHTTAQNIVQCFLLQDRIVTETKEPVTFQLEDNEMEILRGLIFELYSC